MVCSCRLRRRPLNHKLLRAARRVRRLRRWLRRLDSVRLQLELPLADLAASKPGKRVEVIVQLEPGVDPAEGAALVRAAGGTVEHQLPIINGFSTTLTAAEAERLSLTGPVRAVSLNAPVETEAIDQSRIATAYNQSIRSNKVWNGTGNLSGAMYTGKGVGVALLDTGIDGSLQDFGSRRATRPRASSPPRSSIRPRPGPATATGTAPISPADRR